MRREVVIAGIAAAVLVVAGVAYWRWSAEQPGAPAPPPPTVASPQAPPAASAGPVVPSFDVVRIDPQGEAVIAGRAAPGAEVTVHDGDKVVGVVTADKNGEWVLLPKDTLPPGEHQLTLSARNPDGTTTSSEGVVAMVVPEHPPGAQPGQGNEPVAVLLPRHGNGPAKAMQLPRGSKLALDVIEYDAAGKVQLLGRAPPGASIDATLDGKPGGHGTTENTGAWSVTLEPAVSQGKHELGLVAHDEKGEKLAELSLSFTRVAPPEGSVAVDIQPGNNLWRIAQHFYGEGLRYTVIYQANETQIHNPNLIYPGQVFTVPTK